MKTILIKNAQIIDPSQKLNARGSILVKDGQIEWLGKTNQKAPTAADETIEAEKLVACPGFIDLHCHLRDPGFEYKEDIISGTRAAARGGFTTICCMPNTEPPIDNRSVVEYIKSKAAASGCVRVLPIGCITKGRKGESIAEMAELYDAGVIGFSDDGSPVSNSRVMRQAMDYSRLFGLPLMEHCEDKVLVENGQMNESLASTHLGLPGMPAAAEEIMVSRNIILAETTGARLHLCHISTAGSVELVRAAKQKGLRITAEATPHHLTLSEDLVAGYNTNAKVNPPLRSRKDLEALIAGLQDGTIDVIATDHAPHSPVEKQVEFAYAPFGISILETALGMLMQLVHSGRISLELLIAKLTLAPANILGNKYAGLGTLSPGSPADITLFDPDSEWTVDPDQFASKGRNTPLTGRTLKGQVKMTLFQGRIVFDATIKS
jgi:dihydroorotase